MLVDGLGLMLLTTILLLSDLIYFHVVFSRCFLQSLTDLLQFLFAASGQIDVIGKPQVAIDTDDSGGVSLFCLSYCICANKLFPDEFTMSEPSAPSLREIW